MKRILFIAALLFSAQASALYYPYPAQPLQHIANAPSAIVSTGTSSTAFAANPLRTGLACTNFGSANAFLAYGSNTAVSGGGIAILAGSTWWMDDYMFTNQAIQVIGVTTLSCQEFQ